MEKYRLEVVRKCIFQLPSFSLYLIFIWGGRRSPGPVVNSVKGLCKLPRFFESEFRFSFAIYYLYGFKGGKKKQKQNFQAFICLSVK